MTGAMDWSRVADGMTRAPSALTLAATSASQKWCERFVDSLRLGLDAEAAKAQALPHAVQLAALVGDDSVTDLVYVRVP